MSHKPKWERYAGLLVMGAGAIIAAHGQVGSMQIHRYLSPQAQKAAELHSVISDLETKLNQRENLSGREIISRQHLAKYQEVSSNLEQAKLEYNSLYSPEVKAELSHLTSRTYEKITGLVLFGLGAILRFSKPAEGIPQRTCNFR
jgi:hypothetical protein